MKILNAQQFNEKLDIHPITRERLMGFSGCYNDALLGRIVKIRDRYWTTENLKLFPYKERLYPQKDFFYFNDKPEYGVFYTYEGALKVIPEGWHMPTMDDIRSLRTHCMDKFQNLLSAECGGDDLYGFNATYSGYVENKEHVEDNIFMIWVKEESGVKYRFCGRYNDPFVYTKKVDKGRYAFPLRLVRDL